jgi:methionyl-tRNA synthetase
MMTNKLGGMLGRIDTEGKELLNTMIAAKDEILSCYENLDYASAIRRIAGLADVCNKYTEDNQPWTVIKTDPEKARITLTVILNAARILTIYLKPVLPVFAEKIEKFLNITPQCFADIGTFLEERPIHSFIRLVERVEKEKVDAMIEQSKPAEQVAAPAVAPVAPESVQQLAVWDESLTPECTIDDFTKVDLRIAKVVKASAVEGANKLLALELDLGGVTRNVFAGIAKAYKPEDLVGRLVVCVANLKPRQMKFGLSEGMVCAAGPGGDQIFLLAVDSGAKPGQRVH